MSAPTVYLRKQCLLPDGLLLQQSSVDTAWNSVKEISGSDLSALIQEHGWHCIWLAGGFSRISLGRTAESASTKAIQAGLEAISARFNAAEVDSLRVATYGGFYLARVTMRVRQIQKTRLCLPGMAGSEN